MRTCPTCAEQFDDDTRFCPGDGTEVVELTPPDPFVGRTLLGQFELREVAGRGAMGTVYRAWQLGVERPVAVKILRASLMRDPKVVRRFAREARAVARLSHPNIVTVFATGEIDGVPYMVMEYVDGVPLSELIDDQPMDAVRALGIARQIVSALAEAHAANVVHRDLKPANLLVTERRRVEDFVKVLDFGVAKILEGDVSMRAGESQLTRDGAVFGTPHYLAPEQAGAGGIDHRADLYAVGVLLYRMTVGQLPFDGGAMQVMLAHMSQPVTPPSAVVPGFDPYLESVILTALEKNPDARYQSAEQLADAIDVVRGQLLAARSTALARAAAPPAPPMPPMPRAPEAVAPVAPERTTTAPPRPSSELAAVSPAVLEPGEVATEMSVAWRPPGRARAITLSLSALVLVAAVAVAGMYLWRVSDRGESVAIAEPAPAGATEVDVGDDPGQRTVLVSADGYALRAALPERVIAGVGYDIELEAWDPTGQALAAPEIIVVIAEPDGSERGTAAKRTATPGAFRFNRVFEVAGTYNLHVFPPSGRTTMTLPIVVTAPAVGDAPVAEPKTPGVDAGAGVANADVESEAAPEPPAPPKRTWKPKPRPAPAPRPTAPAPAKPAPTKPAPTTPAPATPAPDPSSTTPRPAPDSAPSNPTPAPAPDTRDESPIPDSSVDIEPVSEPEPEPISEPDDESKPTPDDASTQPEDSPWASPPPIDPPPRPNTPPPTNPAPAGPDILE